MADLVTTEHIETILKALKKHFDFVVVDTQSSLHDLELTILDIASRIVLVTTSEIPSIKNTKLFFDVTSALEYPPEKTKLVINQADRRGGIRSEDIESTNPPSDHCRIAPGRACRLYGDQPGRAPGADAP